MTLEVNVFENEEDAKQWVIRECMDNIKIITYWCDDDGNEYEKPEEIEKSIQTLSLEEIIKGIEWGGGIVFKVIYK